MSEISHTRRQIAARGQHYFLSFIRDLTAVQSNFQRIAWHVDLARDFEVRRLQCAIFPPSNADGGFDKRIVWILPAPRSICAIVHKGYCRNGRSKRMDNLDPVKDQLTTVPVYEPDLQDSRVFDVLSHLNRRRGISQCKPSLVSRFFHLPKDKKSSDGCRCKTRPATCRAQPALDRAGICIAAHFPAFPCDKIRQKAHHEDDRDERERRHQGYAKKSIRQHLYAPTLDCASTADSRARGKARAA
ncbi:hypothetical protein ACVIGV_000940 [Rhizobium leguminosarum]